MNTRNLSAAILLGLMTASPLVTAQSDAPQTQHASQAAVLGKPVSLAEMEASLATPGRLDFSVHASANWQVPLRGLLNLEDPAAKAAGKKDGDEPIQVYLYEFTHPQHGRFFIDTGVAQGLLEAPTRHGVQAELFQAFGLGKIQLLQSTGEIASGGKPLRGIFLTHLHLDHIIGLPDLAADIPLYVGRNEHLSLSPQNHMTQATTDALLSGRPPLNEWGFDKGEAIDVFGDASVYALHTPGHTEGSTAYVLNTLDGPVLIAGDTCHTTWGWQQGVEPGDFTRDKSQNRISLLALKALSDRHSQLKVYLGHQQL